MFNRISCMIPNGIEREMDRVINQFVGGIPQFANLCGANPQVPLNVWEDENTVWAEAELPGVNIEDVDVSVRGHELSIKAKAATSASSENAGFLRRERTRSTFDRTVTLGVEVDAERVSATLTNGVLLVTMPKAESAKPRKVEVRVG